MESPAELSHTAGTDADNQTQSTGKQATNTKGGKGATKKKPAPKKTSNPKPQKEDKKAKEDGAELGGEIKPLAILSVSAIPQQGFWRCGIRFTHKKPVTLFVLSDGYFIGAPASAKPDYLVSEAAGAPGGAYLISETQGKRIMNEPYLASEVTGE